MKKTFLAIALFCAFTLSSCDIDRLKDLLSGSATVVIGDKSEEYTSSIVVISNIDTLPFVLGMATTMDIDKLLEADSLEDINTPSLFVYRIADTLNIGKIYSIDIELTEEDIEGFDVESLVNGKFANEHIVGVAKNDSLFYIMNKGTITLTGTDQKKLSGVFSGSAYVINSNANPKISEEQVSLNGEFTSRISPIMEWLMELQAEENDELAERK